MQRQWIHRWNQLCPVDPAVASEYDWCVGGLSPFSGTRSIGMSTFAVFHGASENQGPFPTLNGCVDLYPAHQVCEQKNRFYYIFVTGIQQSSIYNGFYMLLIPIDDSNPSKRISKSLKMIISTNNLKSTVSNHLPATLRQSNVAMKNRSIYRWLFPAINRHLQGLSPHDWPFP